MKFRKDFYKPVLALAFLVFASCGTSKTTSADLVADSQEARTTITQRYPDMADLFTGSHGYAIFPNAGKGAYIIGGASGNGAVYENGQLIGYSDLKQVDIGLQAGGKAFVEVLFFQTQAEMDKFKEGTFELSGNVSAVILEEGASRDVEFNDGIAVITMPKAGAMAGISVGGQRFTFQPLR